MLRAGPEAGSGDRRISAGLQVREATKAVEADARAAAEIGSQRKTIAIQRDNRASRAGRAMATTSRKRQKELKRQEKSKLKEAKRVQRKLEKAAHKEWLGVLQSIPMIFLMMHSW